ncbi:hypothetical protein [Dietzia natronolimnaea]|uniref:hypothetical protein n=1 Tax=Dietzia natronolimnaea TaxID=161920 RepID=UPI0015FB0934|nr:hypothetical protein [Dietzia natronolimnaea]MBB1037412.1 hypothetical protein [Dietzia natronolimnaea]
MSYRQVKAPNINVQARLGMCLEYVQNAFGAGWSGSYALDGWNRNSQFNHPNRNIPSGVFVPIWFDGYWTGIRYGHVAIYKDGVVYSSPWTQANAAISKHDVLGSIADVERIYRMTYIGWSEGIGGTRVVEKVKEVKVATIENQANWRARFNRLHRQLVGNWDMSDAVFRSIVGNEAWKIVESWSDHENANQALADQVLGEKARKEKWQATVQQLTAQVNDLGKRPTQAQLDALKADMENLQATLDEAKESADEERRKADRATAELERAEAEQAKAKREAENFWIALLNTARGWFGGKS